ncbi:MAG: hypothetical protein FWC41_00035 [Firmicutes bacterium]|nr:hypothetical protein [Bacillota bacterium]
MIGDIILLGCSFACCVIVFLSFWFDRKKRGKLVLKEMLRMKKEINLLEHEEKTIDSKYTNIKFICENELKKLVDGEIVELCTYECDACHWIFFGDMLHKCLMGYQTKDNPYYCPACGRKICQII